MTPQPRRTPLRAPRRTLRRRRRADRSARGGRDGRGDPGERRPRERRQPGDPGQLHRLRVRPVPGADPGRDERLAEELAVPRRRGSTSPATAAAAATSPTSRPSWVGTQLRKGWRLLPITLGPQASCHPSFPRYSDDHTINARPGSNGSYRRARKQARYWAGQSVEEAKRLGIVRGSTLWYDLEGFDLSNTHCRESALAFLSAWTTRLHALDYVSGVYSSAGSGIKMLDDARVNRPNAFTLPDRIWIARWDGNANTQTDYIRNDGWLPGGRMKQYRGGAARDLGRRHDQHRPQLAGPRQGVVRTPRRALRRHHRRLPQLRRDRARHHPGRTGQARCSACSRRPASTAARSTASYNRRTAGGRRPLAGRPRLRREHHVEPSSLDGADGGRSAGRSSSSARRASRCGASSVRSTRPSTAAGSR